MESKIIQNLATEPGQSGLPKDYPIPEQTEDLLFYIQRNQNKNTVVYNLNRNNLGHIHQEFPMVVSWINYTNGGERKSLNQIQDKLAYGYSSEIINPETFQFHFVSYEELTFYIAKQKDKSFKTLVKINGELSELVNVYVYAEEFGVFPQVKFFELFGKSLDTQQSVYQRIRI